MSHPTHKHDDGGYHRPITLPEDRSALIARACEADDGACSTAHDDVDFETLHLVALSLATGKPDAPTLVIGRKVYERLSAAEKTLADLRAIADTLSPGPYQWGIYEEATAAQMLSENLSHGSGDCHLIILPGHEKSVVGDDAMRPEHAVTMLVTGNGSKSKDNALGLLAILSSLSTQGGDEEQPEEREPNQNKPIGKCPRCHTPVYTDEGFCGVCRGF